MNASRTAIAFHNEVRSLVDSTTLYLPSLLDSLPAGAEVCGFGDPSFNPASDDETLWELSCDDGHRELLAQTVLVNIRSKTLTFISELVGTERCGASRFSPDGSNISVVSQGQVYLIYRGKQHDYSK
jgi:hypothetical protein